MPANMGAEAKHLAARKAKRELYSTPLEGGTAKSRGRGRGTGVVSLKYCMGHTHSKNITCCLSEITF